MKPPRKPELLTGDGPPSFLLGSPGDHYVDRLGGGWERVGEEWKPVDEGRVGMARPRRKVEFRAPKASAADFGRDGARRIEA